MPVIHHGMSQAYYKSLLFLTSVADLTKLLHLINKAPKVKAIGDAPFLGLLKDDDGDGDGSEEERTPLMLDDVPVVRGDVDTVHRIAMAILRGLPDSVPDLTSRMSITGDDGKMFFATSTIVHTVQETKSLHRMRC